MILLGYLIEDILQDILQDILSDRHEHGFGVTGSPKVLSPTHTTGPAGWSEYFPSQSPD